MQVVAQHAQHRRLAADLLDLGQERRVALQVDELVDQHLADLRPGQPVVGEAAVLPRLHALAMPVPEADRQRERSGVEDVGVLEHLVAGVVLGRQPERACLDAHVDVLRHQHHVSSRMHILQRAHHAEDLVVGLAGGQRRGQRARHRRGLEEQPAGRVGVAQARQRDAVLDRVLAHGDQRVERTADLARVARHFAHPLLVPVELLQRHHRQEHVVLLEAEQADVGSCISTLVSSTNSLAGPAGLALPAIARLGLDQRQPGGGGRRRPRPRRRGLRAPRPGRCDLGLAGDGGNLLQQGGGLARRFG